MSKYAWFGLVALAAVALAPVAGHATINSTDRAKLQRGESVIREVSRDDMPGVEAMFMVHAPVEACYAVLADTARLQEYMPACRASSILARGHGYVDVKLVGDMGEIVERRHLEPPARVYWTLIRGTALSDMHGEWLVQPVDHGSMLRYTVVVRPTIPLPSHLVNFFENKNLPDTIRNVRARIESGGKWAKPGYGQ